MPDARRMREGAAWRAAALLVALVLLALLTRAGMRAATGALDRREAALRAENAWLRARLAAMDARLRELETRADVGVSTVAPPDGAPDQLSPPRPAPRPPNAPPSAR